MKFLDLRGLQDLWSKVLKTRTEVEASNEQGALITIAAVESTVTGSDGLGKKFTISLSGLDDVASAAELEAGLEALYGDDIPASGAITMSDLDERIGDLESGSVVTVEKQATAESGYAATYVVKQNDAQVGVKINIPKDFLVKSASVETVSTADTPYSGAAVGDKYIDFVVNAVDASETAQHIYLPVDDLVDVYTAGNGIDVSNANVISGVVDPTSETFLTVGANGFKLTGVQAAINSAKSDVIGASTDTASADTINGAKTYADDAVAAAAADFATAAQGTKADSAIQSVSGETAVTNGNYVAVSVEAATDSTTNAVTLTSHANVTVQAITSADSSNMGLAEASDVKTYVDSATSGITTTIANMDADLDASGTAAHGGVFVMSGVTEVDGVLTSVDSVEVEQAGAAAAVQTALVGDASATGNTLGKLEDRLETLEGSGSSSIVDQIEVAIGALDSDVDIAATSSTGHVVTTPASNPGTTSTHVSAATVLTSLTITDGIFTAATSQTIEAISDADLASILVAPSAQQG